MTVKELKLVLDLAIKMNESVVLQQADCRTLLNYIFLLEASVNQSNAQIKHLMKNVRELNEKKNSTR